MSEISKRLQYYDYLTPEVARKLGISKYKFYLHSTMDIDTTIKNQNLSERLNAL